MSKIPADEMFLAKIIQNAKALNLAPCTRTEFRDANGRAVTPEKASQIAEIVTSVCAIGAAKCDIGTKRALRKYAGIADGNDDSRKSSAVNYAGNNNLNGYDIGMAFQHAMR